MSGRKFFECIFLSVLFTQAGYVVNAQTPGGLNRRLNPTTNQQQQYDSQGRPIRKSQGNDSLKHRDPLEDSITIHYHYFDSTRERLVDSSINDFYSRFPVPYYYTDLGNFGTAAHSFLFRPLMKPGFDAGFHAYDIYRYRIEDTKFFTTTRPYTELGYMLGSKAEQMVNIMHTQNRKSNLNFVFEYRLINSPGALKSQNSSHNNFRINTGYQSNNKRYNINFIYINNKLKASENGGLQDVNKLDSLALSDPFELLTRLGSAGSTYRNPFNTTIATGTTEVENTIFIRHSFDFGQKDSIVTDSVTYKLFYPRLRLQHSFKYTKYQYTYQDYNAADSDYAQFFNYPPGIDSLKSDTIFFRDQWTDVTNEFSIITYPDKKNLSQFLKLNAGLQILKGSFDTTDRKDFNNIYASAEYRNRTKNQKWDVEAVGQLYLTGSYAGDYSAYISLKRQLSKKLGSLEIGFQNVNRTPSFVNEVLSAFPSIPQGSYQKENITRLFAAIEIPQQNLRLTGNYYATTNYVYFDSFLTSKQHSALFNVLQLGLEKKFKLSRYFNWYTEVYVQQLTGNPPVNVPFILTRNRISFEGNFFKNLFMATGLEIRYYTSYKPDNYSPLTGQFFFQNTYTLNNRPDVNFYFNFRIKSFKAFIRFENLNSLNFSSNNVGFTKHNFTAPYYPAQALWFRLGIWWNFVN